MSMTWVGRIGDYPVERADGPRPGGAPYVSLRNPQAFIVHTTEGSTVSGAIARLRSQFSAPHFVVGENRIVQMRPLTAEASTLRAHNDLGWQVESVGFAQERRHQIVRSTWEPLVALTAFVHTELGIPLVRPAGWKDDLGDIRTMFASNNTRRVARRALSFHGVLGHIDIPDQEPTWHWDPGALDYGALFAEAMKEADVADERLDDFFAGMARYWDQATDGDPGPPKSNWPAWVQHGWAAARRAAQSPVGGGGGGQGAHRHTPGDIPHRHDTGRTGAPEALP